MSVGQVASKIAAEGFRVDPRELTILLYRGIVEAPVEAGRRNISEAQVPLIMAELQRRGKLRHAGV